MAGVATETRDRVLHAARELDYIANPHASRLAASRPALIDLVVPLIDRWYYSTLFAAITRRLERTAFDVIPHVLGEPLGARPTIDRLPFQVHAGGLLLVDVDLTENARKGLEAGDIPVVTVGAQGPSFSSVTVDNTGGAQSAVEHLISLGHSRIACIGALPNEASNGSAEDHRLRGYAKALARAGIDADDGLVIGADYSIGGGAVAVQRLLNLDDRPTALFVLSDEMAVGAISALEAVGLEVPGDISVVGFDDHEFSDFLGLTTVRQDVVGTAWRAVDMLLGHFGNGHPVTHEVLPTRLIVRSSSAAPRRLPVA
jgi:DNA-binding LacI/PurR family transcriptional regulator